MAKVRLFSILSAILFVFSSISSGEIKFVGSGFTPEPNQEITLQIQTDTPLFCYGMGIYITGDANITGAVHEADCNQYGWDNGWNSDPYIDDANGWMYIGGVRMAADANGIVGYIKFRYHSGQVSVYIDQENSLAFGWDGNSCPEVPFSTDILLFGEPDPNDSNQEDNPFSQDVITDENTPATEDTNDVNLPLTGLWKNHQDKHQKKLVYCPAGLADREYILSKADYEAIAKNNLTMESVEKDIGGQLLMDSEPNVTEISSDITTNQLWTANNIYHITANVNIQALLVIEPNTLISFGGSGALFVNNGGTLISVGTPDEPIYYTSDSGNGWYDYYCAIYIESTASPATKIAYNCIDCAYMAIITDNIRLDRPIENNYLFYNSYGIFEYGTRHTDIINNLIYSGFNNEYYSSGIEVFMASSEDVGDANSNILIQNNTCDYHDYGIVVHGVADENDAGSVMLVNNIITQSYECGLNLVDGYMLAVVCNTGYGANYVNKNWEFEEYDPVETTQNPYASGENYLDVCYLDQNSVFVNAGLEYIEQTQLIGKTTDINGTPDNNKIDLGFHNPNWNFANANTGFSAGDFNKDTITDYKDLYTLVANWLNAVTPDSNGDLSGDGTVNFKDFTLFANNWQKIQGHPNIAAIISSDTNETTGSFEVDVNSNDITDGYNFIFMDGQLISQMPELGGQITIDSYKFRNGIHDLKVVHSGWSGITVSAQQPITFNNPIYCANINDLFDIHNDYRINGLHDGNSTLNVQIADISEQVIWSDTYSGSDVNIVIPQSVFSNQMFCSLSITETEAMGINMAGIGESSMTTMDSSSSGTCIDLTRKFNPADYNNLKAIIIMPDKDIYKPKKPAILACAQAFQNRLGNTWAALYFHDVTPENLTNIYSRPTLKYIYWCGHANSHVGKDEKAGIPGVQRTNTQCWRRWNVSPKEFEDPIYTKKGVFSYIGGLPGSWDQDGYDLWGIHLTSGAYMHDSANKKIVFIDGCLSGLYADMADAYGVYYGTSSLDQIYIGWDIEVAMSSEPIGEFFLGASIEGIRMFWERMGLDSSPNNNVYAAFGYVSSQGSSQTRKSLFGLNALWDGGTGDDHIRAKGIGTMSNIRIVP